MLEKILKALGELDVTNDNHWTAEGRPRIETVRLLVANGSLSRDEVTAAAPDFSRSNAVLPSATSAATPAPAPTPAPTSETPAASAAAPAAALETAAPAAAVVTTEVQTSTPVDGVVDVNGKLSQMEIDSAALSDEQKDELASLYDYLSELDNAQVRLNAERAKAQKRVDELINVREQEVKHDPMAGYRAHLEAQVEKNIQFQAEFGAVLKTVQKIPGVRSPLDNAIAGQVTARRKQGQN